MLSPKEDVLTFRCSSVVDADSQVSSQENDGASPQTTTPVYRADSVERNQLASGRIALSEGRRPAGGSPGGNKEDSMEVEGDDSDVVITEDSDAGEQDNEFVSFLNEPSPREQSVERELQLSMTESVAEGSGSERLVVTPSPRPSIHSTEDGGDDESPCLADRGSVEVTSDVPARDTPTMSLRSSSATVQTSLFRRSTAVSLESGDTASPITAVRDLSSSATPRGTRYKEVYKTVSSERVASSFLIKVYETLGSGRGLVVRVFDSGL